MNEAHINSLLRDIPTGVDYTELPEDIDPEDIPPERIKGIVDLLSHEDDYIVFQAARLLTSWGIEEGFHTLEKLLVENELQGMIQHRIYGYDETYKHVLYAFISYWANQSDMGKGEQARKAIFEPVSIIIKASNTQLFQIDKIFRLVLDDDFNEYIPLLKEHLQIIIKNPEDNYWRIHDVIELFLKVDPDFVAQVLKENRKELSNFGF
ncbi:hypothetical protein [Psychrobacter sp. SZ93C1]|uniref:hypothetical protein n=1 Tax=Psychrobacter sp. SZ93C1 TaxID=2792058 RepID=UPI0018CF72C0|nr:hypothetical protein [Psychrobacter sp. SZ93C1]MBH0063694.1 hypothetical protein [Psychrobacter sp. SZ93C1]